MLVNVKIGKQFYLLDSDDFKVIDYLVKSAILPNNNMELPNFKKFKENYHKVAVYDYLDARKYMYKGLLHPKIKDIRFYRKHGLDVIADFLEFISKLKPKDIKTEVLKSGKTEWLKYI